MGFGGGGGVEIWTRGVGIYSGPVWRSPPVGARGGGVHDSGGRGLTDFSLSSSAQVGYQDPAGTI